MAASDLDRGDESIATSRDGLDVGRVRGVVAERLTQLGDGLRQRVIGDRDVRPQRRKELVFADERRLPRHQVQQQVDDFRRKRDDVSTAQQSVRTGVDGKGTEAVRRNHCHRACRKRPQHSIARRIAEGAGGLLWSSGSKVMLSIASPSWMSLITSVCSSIGPACRRPCTRNRGAGCPPG